MINNIVNTASTGGIDIADVVKVIFTIASDTSYIKDAIDRKVNIQDIERIIQENNKSKDDFDITKFTNPTTEAISAFENFVHSVRSYAEFIKNDEITKRSLITLTESVKEWIRIFKKEYNIST